MRRANAPYASFFRTGGRYSYIFGQAFFLLLRAWVGVGRRSLMRGAAGQAVVTAAKRDAGIAHSVDQAVDARVPGVCIQFMHREGYHQGIER